MDDLHDTESSVTARRRAGRRFAIAPLGFGGPASAALPTRGMVAVRPGGEASGPLQPCTEVTR